MYSYTDPCTKELKFISADMSSPIIISYYGQVKAFSYAELQDGTFDLWLNNTYANYKTTAPCAGVLTTTTTTTSTNTVMGLVNNVMTLNSLTSLDLSSTSLGSSTSVGGTTTSGTSGVSVKTKNEKSNDKSSGDGSNNTTSNSGNTSSSGDQSSGQGSVGSSEGQIGNNGNGSNNGNSEGSGSSNSGSSSGSGSNSSSGSSGNGSGGGTSSGTSTDKKPEEKTPEQVEEQKTETQKAGGGTTAKAAAKGKVETQKPAILVTGDIVGIQTARSDKQDARGTMSFTRVKGDGTASIGLSADYMVNARIGNVSGIKSWIGTNQKGNKHINVLSAGLGLMPKSYTTSLLFVRVNSLKNFTALYGAAGSYGQLFNQEIISSMIIGGFMYKGQLSKHLDATIIAAAVYAPYTKYYTESLFEAQPIIVPFLNLNYSITKTFKFGLTGGGTYIANQDIVNYQILMGGKLKI